MNCYPSGNPVLLEYSRIMEILSSKCISELGRNFCEEVTFTSDFTEIGQRLDETMDFKGILRGGKVFPTENLFNLHSELQLLTLENSVLSSESILKLRDFLRTVEKMYSFFDGTSGKYHALIEIFADAKFERRCLLLIEEVFDPKGNIYDDASQGLLEIRRSLSTVRKDLTRTYQRIIARFRKDGKLTAGEESIRNGRRVLSFPSELKRVVKGVIHDYNSKASAFFLEPAECIHLNNKVAELEAEEAREIRKILFKLCRQLSNYHYCISQYQRIAAEFDFCRAKAKFALEMNACKPQMVKVAGFDLHQAYHPLLLIHNRELGKDTVAFDLKLDQKQRIVVISGPNAGGKTVCMKAAGLLQLMFQSGIPIPVSEDSHCGIFESFYVDIGDAQSLENELSTYSGRLEYMKYFAENMNDKSLFLIDEFGSGTEPELGGAIAESILSEFVETGARGIITTHYLNLKLFAEQSEGLINASMAFDSAKLQALYKLESGRPGSSYALVLARKTGLSEVIIARAEKKVSSQHIQLEKLLSELENEKSGLETKKNKLIELEDTLNRLLNETGKINEQLQSRNLSLQNRIAETEKEIAGKLERQINKLYDALSKSDNMLSTLKKLKLEISRKYSRQIDVGAAERVALQLENLKDIKVGAEVRLKGSAVSGNVSEIKGSKVKVLFGDFHTTCSLYDLEPVKKKKRKKGVNLRGRKGK